jgi:hypothetical protein
MTTGALAERDDEWTEGRRYMGLEILTASRKAKKRLTPMKAA